MKNRENCLNVFLKGEKLPSVIFDDLDLLQSVECFQQAWITRRKVLIQKIKLISNLVLHKKATCQSSTPHTIIFKKISRTVQKEVSAYVNM